ncbi:hypothetical protein PP175_28245 (plasmid) [Aneurinibacillus sp. Ricciae_BoGa-3]|uniref:hypothetical protein n=1 Tax=Aneurinibacillus sp. Ricciae_BoGa-3 TaxID=3022697 RepID=UPI002340D580|nr:hypothetical protein [Aneurinibacillus sp. Ricciae_BoGa-3]WCK57082.1 hypothetical protein PP175_28245 [Aneurinibacillus sp. Ricciae_BoGa-3]
MNPLQRAIKKQIEENCKKGVYGEQFNPELQKEIKLKAEELAILTTEDEELMQAIDFAIEESIRVMLIRKE